MSPLGLEDRQWILLATVAYLAAVALGTCRVFGRSGQPGRSYTLGIVALGWAAQTVGLYARGLEYGACPLSNRFELIQFVVWSAIVLYLFVGAAFRVSLLGLFTSGLAASLSLLSLAVPAWDTSRRVHYFGDSPWIETHAALAVFSYGVFGVLAATSAMYLLQSRSLKRKKLGGLYRFLPSIVELAHINVRLLWIGLGILTTSLAIGSVYWQRNPESVDALKLGAAIAVFVLYGIVMALHALKKLSAKRYAWVCILVFAAALLSLDAVNRGLDARSPPPAAAVSRAP